MKPHPLSFEKIRIGTLVAAVGAPNYIRQILPHGFESFALSFWQGIGDLDLKKLARDVKEALGDSGVIISSVGVYGNPLETGEKDLATADAYKKLIDHAHLFGTDIVTGFAGRLRNQPLDASLPRFKKIFGPLAKRAEYKGVRIAFENCPMGGNWKTGDWNIAHNPAAWELMFDAIPSKNLGLEWEPAHQMGELIDPMPQLRAWVEKIFHVHGKDATVLWDIIRREGVSGRNSFVFHRTPGFGDSNWSDIISELRIGGYTGSIDIEGWHDPIYVKELEMTGQVHGLNYLKNARGGSFVSNPKV